MEVTKPHATLGETVNVWRGDLAPVTPQVGPAHVVANDEEDVRPPRRVVLNLDSLDEAHGYHASQTDGETCDGGKCVGRGDRSHCFLVVLVTR